MQLSTDGFLSIKAWFINICEQAVIAKSLHIYMWLLHEQLSILFQIWWQNWQSDVECCFIIQPSSLVQEMFFYDISTICKYCIFAPSNCYCFNVSDALVNENCTLLEEQVSVWSVLRDHISFFFLKLFHESEGQVK